MLSDTDAALDRLAVAGLCLAAWLALGAGCASSAPPPAAPQEPAAAPYGAYGSAAPGTVESALADLDRAEAELAALGEEKDTGARAAEQAPRPQRGDGDDFAACSVACRALGSMRRAAASLCGLAGDADPRCESARVRVTRADERVRASCPACPAQ